jgi:hypothetical protein
MTYGKAQEGIPPGVTDEIMKAICNGAKSAALEHIPLKDAINQVPSFAGLDVNRQLFAVLMECTYLEMQIKVMASEAQVLVHGYADGELANWSKPLNGAVYNIQLHENAHPDSPENVDGLVFREQLSQVSIGNLKKDYGNEDLPNLRANEAFTTLNAFLHCPEPEPNTSVSSMAVQILEGRYIHRNGSTIILIPIATICTSSICGLRPKGDQISSEYLALFLKLPTTKRLLSSNVDGVGLSRRRLESLQISVPSNYRGGSLMSPACTATGGRKRVAVVEMEYGRFSHQFGFEPEWFPE